MLKANTPEYTRWLESLLIDMMEQDACGHILSGINEVNCPQFYTQAEVAEIIVEANKEGY